MKKAEILSLLASCGDAKELYTINEEFSRVKYLMKSVSSRKGIQQTAVEEVIKDFRKVRVGSVVNTFMKVEQMKQEAVIPESERKNVEKYASRIKRYVTEVVALSDRLLAGCIDILSTLSSSRMGDTKREEAVTKTKDALEAIIAKTQKAEINATFGLMLLLLEQNTPQAESEEKTAEEKTESAETTATETIQATESADMSNLSKVREELGTGTVEESQESLKEITNETSTTEIVS